MGPNEMLKWSEEWPELTLELAAIVSRVQNETGYSFCPVEIADVLSHTQRKCEINGKGEEYVPILFENELNDYLMRGAINALSIQRGSMREMAVAAL